MVNSHSTVGCDRLSSFTSQDLERWTKLEMPNWQLKWLDYDRSLFQLLANALLGLGKPDLQFIFVFDRAAR